MLRWHLGLFKQDSMPSQCVTHKLSKELSKKYILYPQYHSILVEESEYGEIFLITVLYFY